MDRFSIDRVEGELAVLVGEDGRERLIDTILFEQEPKEGDIVVMRHGYFVSLPTETEKKRDENNALLRRLLAQQQCFMPGERKDEAQTGDSVGFDLPPKDNEK